MTPDEMSQYSDEQLEETPAATDIQKSTPKSIDPRSGDTARSFYTSARIEAITRVRQRDHALLIFLTVVGVLAGTVVTRSQFYPVLLLVPFLAYGAAVIVSQHHLVIGALASYCAGQLDDFFTRCGQNAPQWERSRALQYCREKAHAYRFAGHAYIICGPPLVSIVACLAIAGYELIRDVCSTNWLLPGLVLAMAFVGAFVTWKAFGVIRETRQMRAQVEQLFLSKYGNKAGEATSTKPVV